MRPILRNYQNELKQKSREAYAQGYRAVCIVAPTGSGKTVLFCDIIASAAEKGNRIYQVSHRKELVSQASDALDLYGVVHGMVHPDFSPQYQLPVQVCSVQTLVRRLKKLPPPDFIVLDECHHATSSTWRKVLNYWPKARILGVTATPQRADGTPLSDVFDCLVEGPTVASLIQQGFLVEPRAFVPPRTINTVGLRTSKGDYTRKSLAMVADSADITGDAVEHYQELADGEPAVAFCVSIKHAENVAQQFREAGYTSEALHGKLDDFDRDRILRGLGDGSINVVTSCDVISEGTDIPRISCIIFLRPTKSLSLYLQQAGRGLRLSKGKKHCIILDHAGNIAQHGTITLERDWTLEGKKKGSRGPAEPAQPSISVWTCENCYCVNRMESKKCGGCGEMRPIKERQLTYKKGKLVALTDEQHVVDTKKAKRIEEAKAETLTDWLNIAKNRGYKRGWAIKRFKMRQKR